MKNTKQEREQKWNNKKWKQIQKEENIGLRESQKKRIIISQILNLNDHLLPEGMSPDVFKFLVFYEKLIDCQSNKDKNIFLVAIFQQ